RRPRGDRRATAPRSLARGAALHDRGRAAHPVGIRAVGERRDRDPLRFLVLLRQLHLAARRATVERDADRLATLDPTIEVECVDRSEDLDVERGLFLRLTHRRGLRRLARENPAAARLPLAWRVVLGAAALEQEDLTIALEDEHDADAEAATGLGGFERHTATASADSA